MTRLPILLAAMLSLSAFPAAAADLSIVGPAVVHASPPPAPHYAVSYARPYAVAYPPQYAAPYARPHFGHLFGNRHVRAQYFVVDLGPDFTGPSINIDEVTYTNTDLRQTFPFINGYYPAYSAAPAISALAYRTAPKAARRISSIGGKPKSRPVAQASSQATKTRAQAPVAAGPSTKAKSDNGNQTL